MRSLWNNPRANEIDSCGRPGHVGVVILVFDGQFSAVLALAFAELASVTVLDETFHIRVEVFPDEMLRQGGGHARGTWVEEVFMVPTKQAVLECFRSHDSVVVEDHLGSLDDAAFAMQGVSFKLGTQTLVLELSLGNDVTRNREDVFVIVLIETVFQEENFVDCSFLDGESAKSIGDDIFDTFDADDLGCVLFHN